MPFIGTDILSQVDTNSDNTNEFNDVYTRFEFTIADPSQFDVLQLRMRYDDGFVAYLNGVEVARDNFTGTPAFNSLSDGLHGASGSFDVFNITSQLTSLIPGAVNVLAIHGMNADTTSSDLLIQPMIVGGTTTASVLDVQFGAPNLDATEDVDEIVFNPISDNQDEEYIALINSGTASIDISGWTVSGEVDFTFQAGTVIPASSTVYISPDVTVFRARTTGPTSGQGLFIQGAYSGHISNRGETLTLTDQNSVQIATVQLPETLSAPQEFLRITEIMFNPSALTQADIDAGFTNNDDFEYLELMNVSSDVLSLDGVKFTDGINFAFPAGLSLTSGERVVLVRDTAAFEHHHGTSATIIGEYGNSLNDLGSFKLSNGGETIKLDDFDNSTILSISYDDKTSEGWYDEADGNGKSLVLIDANGDLAMLSDPLRWRPSLEDGGSPGKLDKLAADFDSDGKVGLKDLLHLKKNFGVGTTEEEGDLTGDAAVDGADVVAFLGHFGRTYVIEETTTLPPSAPAGAAAAAALTVTIDNSTITSTVDKEAIFDRAITTLLGEAITEIQTEEQEDALPIRKAQSQRYVESVDQTHAEAFPATRSRTHTNSLHRSRRGHRAERLQTQLNFDI